MYVIVPHGVICAGVREVIGCREVKEHAAVGGYAQRRGSAGTGLAAAAWAGHHRYQGGPAISAVCWEPHQLIAQPFRFFFLPPELCPCLLYTSDAADDLLCVDLGGRRIIKKKK